MKLSEHQEQKILVRWFRLQYSQYAKYLFAIPNGGVRHIGTAIKIKEEGGMAGVPDLFLMIPKGGWHGMWIEMKAKGGRVSKDQEQFIGAAILMGYQAVVCYGFEDARDAINNYLQDNKK
jgi:hypothetical protein